MGGGLNFLKSICFTKSQKKILETCFIMGGSQFYQNLMNFRPPPFFATFPKKSFKKEGSEKILPFFGGGGEYTSKAD